MEKKAKKSKKKKLLTKEEFRKEEKQKKARWYQLFLLGMLSSTIGLFIILIAIALKTKITFQITCYVIGGLFALVGIILNLISESIFSKEYEKYQKKKKNK